MSQATIKVSEPIAELADLLSELSSVARRHDALGFALMFAPQQIDLPEGYVLVQRINSATGVIELVPTKIDACDLADTLHKTQVFDLTDQQYIQFIATPGRTHGCVVRASQPIAGGTPGRVHVHSPR